VTLDQVKEWQTLVVGVVGFTGVIVTLLVNASIARSVRRNEQAHERAVLRRTLLSEFRIRRDSLESNLGVIREGPKLGSGQTHLFVPTDFGPPIMERALEKVGVLTLGEVETVLLAAGVLREYLRNTNLIAEPKQADTSKHIAVPMGNSRYLEAMTSSALTEVEKAIAALRAEMGPLEYE